MQAQQHPVCLSAAELDRQAAAPGCERFCPTENCLENSAYRIQGKGYNIENYRYLCLRLETRVKYGTVDQARLHFDSLYLYRYPLI